MATAIQTATQNLTGTEKDRTDSNRDIAFVGQNLSPRLCELAAKRYAFESMTRGLSPDTALHETMLVIDQMLLELRRDAREFLLAEMMETGISLTGNHRNPYASKLTCDEEGMEKF